MEAMMSEDKQAQKAIEKEEPPEAASELRPPAGPHARDQLTDLEKTPGAGSLPDGGKNGEADPGTG
jgi:hypothetical protein